MHLEKKNSVEAMPVRNLLLVDDEENISRSLVRLLRQDNYNITVANSGKQGLEILKSSEIGVIISDQRMPEMSGTEFLSQVSQIYPDTIRIVLSGYTDLKTVTDAINEGKIYKFLTKPWDDKLLRQNIEDAFRQYELVEENKRLAYELKVANEELVRANAKLSNSVKTEARNAQLNLRSLQVSQDILQNLPIGIIGFDEDLTIVFANVESHNLFSDFKDGLLGKKANKVIPFDDERGSENVSRMYHEIIKADCLIKVNVLLCKYRVLNNTDGYVAVIIPHEGVQYG